MSDRGASVRIPWQVEVDQKGYIEDRRPNANCDPYTVTRLIVETCCGALAGPTDVPSLASSLRAGFADLAHSGGAAPLRSARRAGCNRYEGVAAAAPSSCRTRFRLRGRAIQGAR